MSDATTYVLSGSSLPTELDSLPLPMPEEPTIRMMVPFPMDADDAFEKEPPTKRPWELERAEEP